MRRMKTVVRPAKSSVWETAKENKEGRQRREKKRKSKRERQTSVKTKV